MFSFEKELLGEDVYGEGTEDEKLDDLEMPDFEEADDDVSELVESILSGSDTDDEDVEDDSESDTDPDLDELEKEYHIAVGGSDAVADECGDGEESVPGIDPAAEVPVEPLSPEDDARGDRLLAQIVTPGFVGDTFSGDEYDEFVESGDMTIAASEGYFKDSFIMEALEDDDPDDLFTEGAFAPEGKKFKMTKKARMKQLYEISLQIEARLHKHPKYKKMMWIYKQRRDIRAEWRKAYHSLAIKRAKRYLKGLQKSKSSGIRKLAAKLTGK